MRGIFFFLIATFSVVSFPCFTGAQCTDPTEPNDNVALAYPVACGTTGQAACIDVPNDIDFFSVSVSTADTIVVMEVGTWSLSNLDSELTLYDADGSTILGESTGCGGSRDPRISYWSLNPKTYYFAVATQDGSTGDYKLNVYCHSPSLERPHAVGNTLKISGIDTSTVLLTWENDTCWTSPPPTHFNIFRANSTTAFLYDQIAESTQPAFQADLPDPLEPIYFFQVQSESPNGTGDLYPAFMNLSIEPSSNVTFDASQQMSADPCQRPNLNTTLPIDFQLIMTDRFGGPIDNVNVLLWNVPPNMNTLGTFCPEDSISIYQKYVLTGMDGPGITNFIYSGNERDRLTCMQHMSWCETWIWAETDYGCASNTVIVRGTQ